MFSNCCQNGVDSICEKASYGKSEGLYFAAYSRKASLLLRTECTNRYWVPRVGNRSGNSRRLTDHRTGILLPGSDRIEIGAAPAGNRCLNRSGLSTLESRPISGIFLLCNGKRYF